MKVLLKRFHLNGHTIGFHPLTQKLESPYKTLSNTLAVKGLIKCIHPSLPVVKHVSINWFHLLLVPFAGLVRMKTNPLMLVESMVPLRSTKWLAISTSLRESKNSQDMWYTFIVVDFYITLSKEDQKSKLRNFQ